MVYVAKRPPIPVEDDYQPLPLFGAFNGGLNTRDYPERLAGNESPDLLNVEIDEDGAIKMAKGYTELASGGSGADSALGLMHYAKDDGTHHLIYAEDDKVYERDGSSLTLRHTFTAGGEPVNGVKVNDTYYMVNGEDTPIKWTGSGAASAVAGIPVVKYLFYFQELDRLIGVGDPANPLRVHYSPVGSYESGWSSFDVEDEGSSELTGGINAFGRAVITSDAMKWTWDGREFGTTGLRPLGKRGCDSHRSLVLLPDGSLFFYNREGFFINRGGFQDEKVSGKIDPTVEGMAAGYRTNVSAKYYDNKIHVAYTRSGQTENDRVLVYDLNWFAWLLKDWEVAVFENWEDSNGNDLLVFGSADGDSTIHKLYTEDETASYDHDGSAIDSYYVSKAFTARAPHKLKKWKKLQYQLKSFSGYSITFGWKKDDESDFRTELVSVDPGTSTWDDGTETWNDGGVWEDNSKLYGYLTSFNLKGRSCQFKFAHNAANEPWKVYGITPHVRFIEGFK